MIYGLQQLRILMYSVRGGHGLASAPKKKMTRVKGCLLSEGYA